MQVEWLSVACKCEWLGGACLCVHGVTGILSADWGRDAPDR